MDHLPPIRPAQIELVRQLIHKMGDNAFVRERIRLNVDERPKCITLPYFWQEMVCALLTSRQRSGPDAPVTRFINTRPFPLCYAIMENTAPCNRVKLIKEILDRHGGIRFKNRLSDYISHNFIIITNGWNEIDERIRNLLHTSNSRNPAQVAADERELAQQLKDLLKGVGNKQSRNILQSLGITRYETPIDSRIARWLTANRLLTVDTERLGNKDYYEYILDYIQALCRASDILPCVLDAAVFAAADGGGWRPENIVR